MISKDYIFDVHVFSVEFERKGHKSIVLRVPISNSKVQTIDSNIKHDFHIKIFLEIKFYIFFKFFCYFLYRYKVY
jgi:hypothetical protein